ncbi:bifunctional phosphoserine phosphatase/homoserine phosphotransferase ThrH [Paraherbaspirillum soli]|uniref:phosphoserine phosphatase n=1 Tax=Paraherbaspirillum soli TaxID=631222 RepID=A0ABW0M9X0_9BURK
MMMICLDVEGVLLPELWLCIAEATGISDLKRTTRDEPDFDALMRDRIAILRHHGIRYRDLLPIINAQSPLPGAAEFLASLRQRFQVSLVSDSFYEFLMPLSPKLGYPTIFCHHLQVSDEGWIVEWQARLRDQKPKVVNAFKQQGFLVVAAGDSYNDLGMLQAADAGFFIHAPDRVTSQHPERRRCHSHTELFEAIDAFAARHSTQALLQVRANAVA